MGLVGLWVMWNVVIICGYEWCFCEFGSGCLYIGCESIVWRCGEYVCLKLCERYV